MNVSDELRSQFKSQLLTPKTHDVTVFWTRTAKSINHFFFLYKKKSFPKMMVVILSEGVRSSYSASRLGSCPLRNHQVWASNSIWKYSNQNMSFPFGRSRGFPVASLCAQLPGTPLSVSLCNTPDVKYSNNNYVYHTYIVTN